VRFSQDIPNLESIIVICEDKNYDSSVTYDKGIAQTLGNMLACLPLSYENPNSVSSLTSKTKVPKSKSMDEIQSVSYNLRSIALCCRGLKVTVFVPRNIEKLKNNVERGGIMIKDNNSDFIQLSLLNIETPQDFGTFVTLLDKLFKNNQ